MKSMGACERRLRKEERKMKGWERKRSNLYDCIIAMPIDEWNWKKIKRRHDKLRKTLSKLDPLLPLQVVLVLINGLPRC
jgi:hypothetical protein